MQVRILSAMMVPLLAGAIALPSVAQTPLNLPTDRAGIVALQARQQKEEVEMRKTLVSKEPGGDLDALPTFILQHPAFSEDKGAVSNYAYYFRSYLQKGHPDSKTLDLKMHAIQDALLHTVPAYYQGMFDFEMARLFLKYDWSPAEAKTLVESAVALYSQSDCLQDDRFSAESRHVGDERRGKQPVLFTYHIEDGEMHCGREGASRYATLGKIQAKLGETDAAVDSFQMALHMYASMEAALGLATIYKAKGDKPAELEMLTEAYLTGDMPAENILEAKALYTELHPGSISDDYEALLDQRYAKTFVNPVKYAAASSAQPQHVVLDELFTGGGCEPCMAPDLATEATLHRYTRDQVIFAIYHNNAPVSDPLTNNMSVARAKYYGTGGSTPHVFLDGKEADVEEGQLGHAQSAFDLLTKAIDPLLATPSKETLNLAAHREGDLVEVTVTGKAGVLPAKAHLQVLLLETEVSYSGENTLRFQPMVVRAGAGLKDQDTGFAMMPSEALSQHFSFDLKKIEADNFAYYDQSRQELEKRLASLISSGGMSKAEIDKMGEFREPKNLIHPDRLAVVAFLQADDSKQVLQTSYTVVSGGHVGESK